MIVFQTVNHKYSTRKIEEVLLMILAAGHHPYGARIDIQHAFRNLGVRFVDIPVLGLTIKGKYYINSSVPFGSASSCKIFERVVCLLEWIARRWCNSRWISHYLDDFPLIDVSSQATRAKMIQFEILMKHIGMPVASDKTIRPTDSLEYLGLLLDLKEKVVRIPESKRVKCITLIDAILSTQYSLTHSAKNRVTLKTVEKTAGTLNFVCQALPAGRVFLRSLYAALKVKAGKVCPHQHVKVGGQLMCDLEMFQTFLVHDAPDFVSSVSFLLRTSSVNTDIVIKADAAGSYALGFGAIWEDRWIQGNWGDTDIFKFKWQKIRLPSGGRCVKRWIKHPNTVHPTAEFYKPNIALLELFAIVTALTTWAQLLSGNHICLKSDNMAVVHMLNNKCSDCKAGMDLLRALTLTCLRFQTTVTATHIPGVINRESDLISRCRMEEFRTAFPHFRQNPDPLPPSIWPPMWNVTEMTRNA